MSLSKTIAQPVAPGIKYYLGLAACGGSPSGHAFVVWGTQTHPDSSINYTSFGFYPSHHTWPNHFKSLIFWVPGEVLDETNTGSLRDMRNIVMIEVDSSLFYNTQRMKEEWRTKRFKLFTNDCVTFVQRVGQRTTLRMPQRRISTFTPKLYLKKTIAFNNGKIPESVLICDKCCLYNK